MNGPRSRNRREFNVTTTGWFTVLKPTRWSSAARLPDGLRYLVGGARQTAVPTPALMPAQEQKVLGQAGARQTTMSPQIAMPNTYDHSLMRPALIVLAAAAITLALLWWITGAPLRF